MRRRTPRLAVLAAAAALLVPGAALASEIVCHPNYDFCVEVDGKYPKDARFFSSETRGKFFVEIPSASPSGVLIDLPERKAMSVPAANVTVSNLKTDPPGTVRVKDDPPKKDDPNRNAPAYALSIEGPVLQFQAADSKIRVLKVLDRPPVVGPVALEDLVADRPEYREGMRAYNPDKTALDAIKGSKKPIELDAYFATWCPHCKIYMPKFLKVIQEAGNPNLKVSLCGVPKNFGAEKGPWEGKGIQSIPTVIVKYEGKELTRLSTPETSQPEIEIAALLSTLK